MTSKYEISLWEDYLVPATGNVPEHYEEKKIAIIGSNAMNDRSRAVEPKLVSNINGTNTFTFKMYYSYKKESVEDEYVTINGQQIKKIVYDETNVQNPYLPYLVNERKVKVLFNNKWYDFVIKNCQEDSAGKSITYTCIDSFINELSKTGFELTFDTELENNQGTAVELGKKVVEGTDWDISETGNDILRQYKEEPVYELVTEIQFNATDEITKETFSIPQDSTVLVFYSEIQKIVESSDNSGTIDLEFVYSSNYTTETNGQLVSNGTNYKIEGCTWEKTEVDGVQYVVFKVNGSIIGAVYYLEGISFRYRASRLVQSQVCVHDALTNKYCYVYKATADAPSGSQDPYSGLISKDDVIYCHRSSEFKSPTSVNNLFVNNKDFTTTDGWQAEQGSNIPIFKLYPEISASSAQTADDWLDSKSYLLLKMGSTSDPNAGKYSNSGLKELSNYIPNGISIGEKYIFRYKARKSNGNLPSDTYVTASSTDPRINLYIQRGAGASETFFRLGAITYDSATHWVERELTCIKSFPRSETYGDNGVRFVLNLIRGDLWIEEIQVFKYVEGEDANGNIVRINPGDLDTQSVSKVYYNYYNKTKTTASKITDPKEIKYLYKATEPLNLSYVKPQFNDDYEKIRSITVEKSNRFNILQTIAETFECWVRFTIEHEENGNLIYINGKPQKHINFVETVGEETGLSFIYGIDLKSIQRTVQSNQIVTKVIVPPNNNEFGKQGYCAIGRSEENYPLTDFILNFDYYISQGLLDGGQLNKDLYLSTDDSIGYYYHLHELGSAYNAIQEYLPNKKNERDQIESWKDIYVEQKAATEKAITEKKGELIRLANVTTWAQAQKYINDNKNNEAVYTKVAAIASLQDSLPFINDQITKLTSAYNKLNEDIEEKEEEQEGYSDQIKALNEKFFNKYSRFIQEGTWYSDDYEDDNLYYLDALSVAYTSSRPQVSYNISVLKLDALEEFKSKVFNLGDIGSIIDTDFFGYVYINGIKTPYKEKVLISEVTYNFDEPEKDSFKIQNYKTQFEELFQRITAQTQALQFASGQYARAANVVTTQGTIQASTLEASLQANQNLVYSAKNELVKNDSTGITVSNSQNPNYKTKVTSGGVFVTTDGGTTWTSAVNGNGVSANLITSGQLDTKEVVIIDGNYPTFRWDTEGITAYNHTESGANFGKFVRFDQYGVYGMNKALDGANYVPANEQAIWDDGRFGLTWKGFFLKSITGQGQVEISTDNDILVSQNKEVSGEVQTIDRIKIGRINDPNEATKYGMVINDADGNTVLEAKDNGELWLEDKLHIVHREDTSGGETQVYDVKIGNLGIAQGEDKAQVINSSDNFIVYEDGSIVAKEGTFSGEISASTGSIGGFTIGEKGIYSKAGEGTEDNFDPYIKIESDDGTESNQTSITVGDIVLNGTDSTIEANGGQAFSISPELAVFNNIQARGKISSVIFETDKTQVVGGVMFFKTAYKVESTDITENSGTIYLEEEYSGSVGDYIYVINSNGRNVSLGKVTSISSSSDEGHPYINAIFRSNIDSTEVFSIVSLGKDGEIVIGINSTENSIESLKSQGITISEVVAQEGTEQIPVSATFNTKAFLGNLSNLNISGVSGYGLYSSNAFLNGSLTTQIDGNNYAGINTMAPVISDKFGGEDNDGNRIIIWGGANSTTEEGIRNAAFQVTKNGSLYANKGIFEGTVRSADIEASRIHGIGENGAPGLSFFNTTNGIAFYDVDYDEDQTQTPVFIIGQTGFTANGESFISINNGAASFVGSAAELGNLYTTGDDSLHIYEDKIDSSGGAKLELNNEEIKLYKDEDTNISMTDSEISINNDKVNVEGSLSIKNKMQYKPVTNGCNLYIM